MDTIFLDTETTGFSAAAGDLIVEVAIVDSRGRPIVDTLVNPERSIPVSAQQVHGITSEMVAGAPTMKKLWPELQSIMRDKHIVIYNASFDIQFFPAKLQCAAKISCAMLRFAKVYGEPNPRYGDYRWHRLEVAARHVGHKWTGNSHRAFSDAMACRSVWMWLEMRSTK